MNLYITGKDAPFGVCPLIRVPDTHGKLIDANVLAKKMAERGWKHPDSTIHEFVEDDLPAVIPASR